MRNDGLLYTGLTSQAQLQRLEAAKKEKKRQKANQKAKILPSAELLIELLKQRKESYHLETIRHRAGRHKRRTDQVTYIGT